MLAEKFDGVKGQSSGLAALVKEMRNYLVCVPIYYYKVLLGSNNVSILKLD